MIKNEPYPLVSSLFITREAWPVNLVRCLTSVHTENSLGPGHPPLPVYVPLDQIYQNTQPKMATTNAQRGPGEVSQQTSNKWQHSTKDIWNRSTRAWYESKDRYHQATVEAYHRSTDSLSNSQSRCQQGTTDAWRRSSNSLSNSKDRCHQSTMDLWQRSSNTWKNSKTRCRQSTAEMLSRSAIKLYQSTDRLHKSPYASDRALENSNQSTQASKSNPSLPSSLHRNSLPAESFSQCTQFSQPSTSPNPSQDSQPPQYSTLPKSPQNSQSSQSSPSSDTSTDSMPPKYQIIDPSSDDKSQDQQIRELLNMTDHTFFRLHQAKQLRNSKSVLLGEIEHNWINSTITDAQRTGQDLAKLVEPHRLDMAKRKGKITAANKKRWKLEDCQKACEKQASLILHQDRLDKVFTHLQNIVTTEEETSPELSPNSVESHPDTIPELEATKPPLAELIGDAEFIPAPAELPSDSNPETIIAELPCDSPILRAKPVQPVPKIIITRTPEDISVEYIGSPTTPDHSKNETNEMNEVIAWKQTRNDVRLQQSASLSNIIADMDNARIK